MALHPAMMSEALIGCDVLPAAAHLTASYEIRSQLGAGGMGEVYLAQLAAINVKLHATRARHRTLPTFN